MPDKLDTQTYDQHYRSCHCNSLSIGNGSGSSIRRLAGPRRYQHTPSDFALALMSPTGC